MKVRPTKKLATVDATQPESNGVLDLSQRELVRALKVLVDAFPGSHLRSYGIRKGTGMRYEVWVPLDSDLIAEAFPQATVVERERDEVRA